MNENKGSLSSTEIGINVNKGSSSSTKLEDVKEPVLQTVSRWNAHTENLLIAAVSKVTENYGFGRKINVIQKKMVLRIG